MWCIWGISSLTLADFSPPFPLLRLPPELMNKVVAFVDNKTLLTLREVCPEIKDAVDSYVRFNAAATVVAEIRIEQKESAFSFTLLLPPRQSRLFLLDLSIRFKCCWTRTLEGLQELSFSWTLDDIPVFLRALKPLIMHRRILLVTIDWQAQDCDKSLIATDFFISLSNFFCGLTGERLVLSPICPENVEWNRMGRILSAFRPAQTFLYSLSIENLTSIIAKLGEVPAMSVVDLRSDDESQFAPGISEILLEVFAKSCWYLDLGACSMISMPDIDLIIESLPLIKKPIYFFARVDYQLPETTEKIGAFYVTIKETDDVNYLEIRHETIMYVCSW